MMKPNVIAAINVSLWIGGSAFPISNTAIIVRRGAGASVARRDNARPRHTLLQVSMMSSDVDSDVDDDDGDVYDDDDNTSDRIIYPPRKPMQSDMFLSEFDETIDWEPLDIDEMDDFFNAIDYPGDDYVDIEDGDEDFLEEFDKETLLEILGLEDDGRTITISNEDDDDMLSESELFSDWNRLVSDQQTKSKEVPMKRGSGINKGIASLERALLGGVVPVEAGVGSGVLPGDQGFDPLDLSTKDYFKQIQNFILKLVPARKSVVADENQMQEPEAGAAMPTVGFVGDDDDRPPALILRDYREAEIRHGRLAMLAAIIWPLQEILDRIFIPDSFGSTTVIYGGPTLPFMPLLMTFFLLNLGYLDIYSSEIKENESGDAFLPGECFWDPLCVMQGASDRMKRNMQEREILNGRAAMIAVASFVFEEVMTHKPLVALPTNALLFMPAYQVPYIQQWLDFQFGNIDYSATSIIDPGL